ncbi:MAG: bifunctional nuclease family protein [Spirochaetaceae bacterium]|nr:bifunctional nuclease family protein [Spirochaetaceae bacterium]
MGKENKLIGLTIKGISLHQESQLPVIILQSTDEKNTIPISIGPFEASAIITELENIHPPRPLTHDLFSEILLKHKFRLTSLYIYKSVKEKYYARIYYKKNLRTYSMEVRPSDGIALIIRHGGDIMTNLEVISDNSNNFWLYEVDNLSQDFLFLKNNNTDHTFM